VALGLGSGDDIDLCGTALYTGETNSPLQVSTSLGPFDLGGRGSAESVSCTFKASDPFDNSGLDQLFCGGIQRDCKRSPDESIWKRCDGNNVALTLDCSWS